MPERSIAKPNLLLKWWFLDYYSRLGLELSLAILKAHSGYHLTVRAVLPIRVQLLDPF